MEKISLYDLLSILLPGALLTLVIEIMVISLGFEIDNLDVNDYFKLTLFLSSSIFLGSLINIATRSLLERYKKFGLYTPIPKIYKENNHLKPIKPFFQEMMDTFNIKLLLPENNENENEEKKIEKLKIDYLWSVVYYELEAKNQINTPKSYQSFYFFFRNFFTLGIILFLLCILFFFGKLFCTGFSWYYLALPFLNLPFMFFCILASKWNRVQMVQRMFWIYYSLNKN